MESFPTLGDHVHFEKVISRARSRKWLLSMAKGDSRTLLGLVGALASIGIGVNVRLNVKLDPRL